MSMPTWLAVFAALSSTACVRIERRTTEIGVPPALEGAWSGTWASTGNGGQGSVAMRLQSFEGRPVVRIESSHPCLQPGSYEFSLQPPQLELRRSGVPVFLGAIDSANRRIVGTYGCTADAGTWSVGWTGALPPIGDASGIWTGTFTAGSPPASTGFTMELRQGWQAGFLTVTGEVVVDGIGVGVPIESGSVEWEGNAFDLALRGTQLGLRVQVQGTGTLQSLPVCAGLLLVDLPTGGAIGGTWNAVRTGD